MDLEAGVVVNERIRLWLDKAVESKVLSTNLEKQILQHLTSNEKNISVPFSLLKSVFDIHKKGYHLHELLQGVELTYPKVPVKKRDPVLDARVKRLKAEQELKEYTTMVKNVSAKNSIERDDSLGHQYKILNRYIFMMINFVLTVACVFIFGYKAMEYYLGESNMPMQMMAGVILATMVFVADLYFILKNDV